MNALFFFLLAALALVPLDILAFILVRREARTFIHCPKCGLYTDANGDQFAHLYRSAAAPEPYIMESRQPCPSCRRLEQIIAAKQIQELLGLH